MLMLLPMTAVTVMLSPKRVLCGACHQDETRNTSSGREECHCLSTNRQPLKWHQGSQGNIPSHHSPDLFFIEATQPGLLLDTQQQCKQLMSSEMTTMEAPQSSLKELDEAQWTFCGGAQQLLTIQFVNVNQCMLCLAAAMKSKLLTSVFLHISEA